MPRRDRACGLAVAGFRRLGRSGLTISEIADGNWLTPGSQVEACQDLWARFLRDCMDREVTPTLDPMPGVDLDTYKATLIGRFSNAEVADTVARLCAQTSTLIPEFVLPVVHAQLASGGEVHRAAAVVASWARFAEGLDEQGRPVPTVDRRADRLEANARRQREEPLAFLAERSIFGGLVDQDSFVNPFLDTLDALHRHGTRATLQRLTEGADLAS